MSDSSATIGSVSIRPREDASTGTRPEHRPEPVERVVCRAVVDDDHLELGVVEIEKRPDRVRQRDRLVEGGKQHADRRREPRRTEHVEILESMLPPRAPAFREADEHERADSWRTPGTGTPRRRGRRPEGSSRCSRHGLRGDRGPHAESNLPSCARLAAASRRRRVPAARIRLASRCSASCASRSSSAPTSWSTRAAACRRSGSSASSNGSTTVTTSAPATTNASRAASRTHHDSSPSRIGEEGCCPRSADRHRRAARVGADPRMGVVEKAERAAQRLRRPRCSKGLERSRPDVGRRVTRQLGNVWLCERWITRDAAGSRRSERGHWGARAAG